MKFRDQKAVPLAPKDVCVPKWGALTLLAFTCGQSLLMPMDAGAVPITRTYDFMVNNVQDQTGVPPPINPVVGSVTVAFDPALGLINNQTSGITVNSLNVPVASPIAFSYSAANTDELQIGGLDQGTSQLTEGVNDFLLDIFDASGALPFFGNMDYTSTSRPFSVFQPGSRADGTVSIGGVSVPEPSTLWLIVTACFTTLASMRIRRPFKAIFSMT